jgi:hypothetical protein
LYLRGGVGFVPKLTDGVPLYPAVVLGAGYTAPLGTVSPEAALSATFVPGEPGIVTGPYLGVRFATLDRSVVRLGGHLFVASEEGGHREVFLWPALSFGGRF